MDAFEPAQQHRRKSNNFALPLASPDKPAISKTKAGSDATLVDPVALNDRHLPPARPSSPIVITDHHQLNEEGTNHLHISYYQDPNEPTPHNMLLGVNYSPPRRSAPAKSLNRSENSASASSTTTTTTSPSHNPRPKAPHTALPELSVPPSHDSGGDLNAAVQKPTSATFAYNTLPYRTTQTRSPYLNRAHAMSDTLLPLQEETTSTFPRSSKGHIPDDETVNPPLTVSVTPSPLPSFNSPSGANPPATSNIGPPIVMLPYASKRRDQEFHELFAAITPEEVLIEDFACAWQKEILIQGRLYVSERHVCFHANILGWAHDLVLRLTDIVNIDKKNIALLIPNSLEIATRSGRKYFFASFMYRDSVFDLVQRVWQIAREDRVVSYKLHTLQRSCLLHEENSEESDDCSDSDRRKRQQQLSASADGTLRIPQAATVPRSSSQGFPQPESPFATVPRRRRHSVDSIESPISGVVTEYSRCGDLPSSVSPTKGDGDSGNEDDGDDDDEYNDMDESHQKSTDTKNVKNNGSSTAPAMSHAKLHKRRRDRHTYHPGVQDPHQTVAKTSSASGAPKPAPRFAGVAVCPDDSIHKSYTRAVDVVIPAHMSRVWNLLYGNAENFARQWLEVTKKNTHVIVGAWNPPGQTDSSVNGNANDDGVTLHSVVAEGWSRKLEYTMPLNFTMFPVIKSTRCNIVEKVTHCEFDRFVCIESITSTPDVPAGNCFQNHVRTCISAHGPNQTRLRISVQVEFLRSTLLRSTIEKATAEGALSHSSELSNGLITYIQGHPDRPAAGHKEAESDNNRASSPHSTPLEGDQSSLSDVRTMPPSISSGSVRAVAQKPPSISTSILAAPTSVKAVATVSSTSSSVLSGIGNMMSFLFAIILAPFNVRISNEGLIIIAIFAVIVLLSVNTYVMFRLSDAMMRFEQAIAVLTKG
ncbi:hypothetical protein SeLEV6574_g04106 [Synchytrium endobioticum]|nr:hypothetical protein SeLEV6574_g04106 [Synchytrium endobioticum]